MNSEHVSFLRSAFEEYLYQLCNESLEPSGQVLDYDFNFLNNKKWSALGESLVGCEIRELTNLMNRWNSSLYQWHAWNKVLKTKNENEAWELRSEFVESLAYECLLKPSSIRDTFTSVATNALHQVRLSIEPSYTDFLKGDPTPIDKKPRYLNKKQKENRLIELIKNWQESKPFIRDLKQINSIDYIRKTSNYRNLVNHTIGPRLSIGHTRTVTRSVLPATKMEPADDGSYIKALVPDKMSVSYGFGGTPPLNIEEIRLSNFEQFKIARSCYLQYKALLKVAISSIENTA